MDLAMYAGSRAILLGALAIAEEHKLVLRVKQIQDLLALTEAEA